jgi:hypothetical protein
VKRPHWERLAAIIVGLSAGLVYAWVLAPHGGQDTTPDSLRLDFQDGFRASIASAYAVTGDLERARARLALLRDADPVQALTAQAQRALSAGLPFEQAQELALLASDLQAGVSSLPSRTPPALAPVTPLSTPLPGSTPSSTPSETNLSTTPGTAAPTATRLPPTLTPLPSRTPMPSPSAPFEILSREELCDPALPPGQLQINVLDRQGAPLPGIEITITWSGGEERFFTGLQPEVNDGYADYLMQPGTSYSLQVARLGEPVSALSAPNCPASPGQPYIGGLQLTFQQP